MKLKGKTTIQLFDAETGEMTHEVENENLVTNAVKNIFNGVLNQYAKIASGTSYNFDYLFSVPNNVAKDLYGGLLIFSGKIEENVEHCIPTPEEIKTCIGTGNQGASRTGDTHKGNFNAIESVVGDNYVTFVWDFSTEQCNGDIACICLTSDVGGEYGYAYNIKDNYNTNFVCMHPEMWAKNTSIRLDTGSGKGVAQACDLNRGIQNRGSLYIYNGNIYCFTRAYDDGTLYVYENLEKSDGIGLLDDMKLMSVSETRTITTSRTNNDGNILNPKHDAIYAASFNNRYSLDGLVLRITRFYGDGDTEDIEYPMTNVMESVKEYLPSNNISSINNVSSCNFWVQDEKICFLAGQVKQSDKVNYPDKLRLYMVAKDGTYSYKDVQVTDDFINLFAGSESDYNLNSGSNTFKGINVAPIYYLGRYFLCGFYGTSSGGRGADTNVFMINTDGSLNNNPAFGINRSSGYIIDNAREDSKYVKSPWVVGDFGFISSGSPYLPKMLWKTYLATINNQDTVLTKTADKTMKIIYTLTQEE